MDTLLVTTDFSETAQQAAEYAVKLSRLLGVSRIILYHSYDQAPVATDIPIPEPDSSLAHEGSLFALEVVDNHLRKYLPDGVDTLLVANELPLVLGVEQLIEQQQVGLVVAGTTGKSGVEKLMVGSNTVNLASSCPAPLLIVPKGAEFRSIERIVFACDLKKVSSGTPVAEIRFWLDRLKAELLVLNVALEGKRFNPDVIPEQYRLHTLLDNLAPAYHYTESDDIAEEIEDFAENQHAGLIITIPKSYGFFEGLFHRSISKRLINETEIPLLLLRERD